MGGVPEGRHRAQWGGRHRAGSMGQEQAGFPGILIVQSGQGQGTNYSGKCPEETKDTQADRSCRESQKPDLPLQYRAGPGGPSPIPFFLLPPHLASSSPLLSAPEHRCFPSWHTGLIAWHLHKELGSSSPTQPPSEVAGPQRTGGAGVGHLCCLISSAPPCPLPGQSGAGACPMPTPGMSVPVLGTPTDCSSRHKLPHN